MTKRRAAITFENAITRIAARIGWPAMVDASGLAERTLRNWSDPETGQQATITAALQLGLAYRSGGGGGAPLYETYGLLLDQAHSERFADQVELAHRTCAVIREGADAEQALVLATIPGATAAQRATARREIEESIAAHKAALPLLAEPEEPP